MVSLEVPIRDYLFEIKMPSRKKTELFEINDFRKFRPNNLFCEFFFTKCPQRSSTDKISACFRAISDFKTDISDSQSFNVSAEKREK